MVGVILVTAPMKPMRTPATVLTMDGGNSVLPSDVVTLATTCGKRAPGWRLAPVSPSGHDSVSASALLVRQPPPITRSSSSLPASNSWLPGIAMSTPMRFITSTVLSCRNSAEISGVPPMASPLLMTMLWAAPARNAWMVPARWAAPPAARRMALSRCAGSGQGSVRPVDSRLPWKSLKAIRRTFTGSLDAAGAVGAMGVA